MRFIKYLLLFFVLLVGFGAGIFTCLSYLVPKENSNECTKDYTFINDSLGCEPKLIIKKHQYTELSYNIDQYTKQQNANGDTTLTSVFFRDFLLGPTFGLREKEEFAPASLLKVPLLVALLNKAEAEPAILEEETSYTELSTTLKQTTEVPELKPNTLYSVKELLDRMLIYSDNVSFWLLESYLEKRFPNEFVVNDTMRELGLVSPRTSSENTITVKGYSSLFRQLFNSSYLSPEMSEYALSVMSKSRFDKGLVAGLPQDIDIAHKFGEIGLPNGEKQLHDCGIIYYPGNPYLLCIMTKGNDAKKLSEIIKTISSMVYKEVNSRRI